MAERRAIAFNPEAPAAWRRSVLTDLSRDAVARLIRKIVWRPRLAAIVPKVWILEIKAYARKLPGWDDANPGLLITPAAFVPPPGRSTAWLPRNSIWPVNAGSMEEV